MQFSEAKLKEQLTTHLRKRFPRFVILRLEDRYTHGIPDIVIFGNKMGSAIEVKFADPDFKTRGVQDLTLARINKQTSACYVIYELDGNTRRTYILEPADISLSFQEIRETYPKKWIPGFNHEWVGEYIRKIHDNPV